MDNGKQTKPSAKPRDLETQRLVRFAQISTTILGIIMFALVGVYALFESRFDDRIYPNVYINGIAFGGQTQNDVEAYWHAQNTPFSQLTFTFTAEGHTATVSATDLDLGYDATLSAKQAYLVGRSRHLLSNLRAKFLEKEVHLSPYFRWKTDVLDTLLSDMAIHTDVPAQDALFQIEHNIVTAFRTSHDGKTLDIDAAKIAFQDSLASLPSQNGPNILIDLPVVVTPPDVRTEEANDLGIKELIGKGYSEFTGSIPGRIHNVALAASRINGHLIAPGETFSFNEAIGDISAATGYQSAYIIKDGRTLLGDGGGVCQVSTTLFRAALDAGLPITERTAHSYRVSYYEQAGYKPGLDATVYSPSVDLKIENDSDNYMLIQAYTDTAHLTLTFELYGTNDGRTAQIVNHDVWGQSPAPPPLYQEDPTLAPGVVKQVDWAAAGARTSFEYKVTRDGQTLHEDTFYSNFRPWQAVYLTGPEQI